MQVPGERSPTELNKFSFPGASSGIGAASAVLYAKHGAKLVINGRNEEKLKKTASLCEEQGIQKENVRIILNDYRKSDSSFCNQLVKAVLPRISFIFPYIKCFMKTTTA